MTLVELDDVIEWLESEDGRLANDWDPIDTDLIYALRKRFEKKKVKNVN